MYICRWLRLRLNMMPFVSAFLEPLAESIPLGGYMSWSVYHFFGFSPYIFFFIHWGVWMVLDYIQLRGVQVIVILCVDYGFLIYCIYKVLLEFFNLLFWHVAGFVNGKRNKICKESYSWLFCVLNYEWTV